MLPPGGPPDTTPPSILVATPAERTLNFRGTSVVLEFSEYVDRAKVRENLFVSPPIAWELDWSGRDVEIAFTDSLQPQTTYALTLGTEYADRAGNKPEKAYTLIFSTGDRLDSGIVRGRIVDGNAEGAFVFLYPLAGIRADTLNPGTTKPKYRTQVGKNGVFEFQALSNGTYRIVAVRDEFRNELYDFGVDAFGAATSDVEVREGGNPSISLRLGAAVDNTAPQLYSATLPDAHIVRLECSEAVDTASVQTSAFILESVGTQRFSPPSLLAAYISPSRRFSVELMLEQALPVGSEWRIVAAELRDSSGNRIADTANAVAMSVAEPADTLLATLLRTPFADSTRGIESAQGFPFVWSTALDTATAEQAVVLADSAGNAVPRTLRWAEANAFSVVPLRPLQPNTWYQLRLAAAGIRDRARRTVQDTSVVVHFLTADPSNYGTVTGSIVDSTGGNCSYVITLATEDKKRIFRTTLSAAGAWQFTNVPPGTYTLQAFCDADGNDAYSYGAAYPYQPAERFILHPSTISVRPRWTVEDVVLRFDDVEKP